MDNINWKEKLFMRRIKGIKGLELGSTEVKITFDDGSYFLQYHEQDCCESVSVEQVDADPVKFIGAAAHNFVEKVITDDQPEDESGYSDISQTATFYTLVTSKGYLDWRWLGESNGYYSESVDCDFIEPNKTKENT